ncbi:MAG: glycosyltransferase family 4 protein [Stellaceae bacterium]
MHLCIVTPNVLKGDGQGRVNYEITQEAIRRGHRLTLVSSNVDVALMTQPTVEVIPLTGRPPQLRYDFEFRHRSTQWLNRNRQRFDLVITNGTATAASTDINVVNFTSHGWWQTSQHPWKVKKNAYGLYQLVHAKMQRHWEQSTFLRAKWNIAVSSRIRDELIDLGVNERSITVIFNGADLDEFKPGPARRAAFGLPSDVPLGLFVGDIRLNRKNLATVLKGLVRVPEMHLAVAGDLRGSPYPVFARALGLSGRVHFLGKRMDVADLMRSCDLFVFPSFYEGFALSVVEAMASGLPVIVSDRVGTSEIVTDECGFVLSQAENCEALADAMQRVATDPVLRRRMGTAARRIAEQHSWAAKAAEYLDLFESRLSADRPQSAPRFGDTDAPAYA